MPRGRPRKRDTRMDAALDAMRPYGFGAKLVYKTVHELLKVYGEEGWVFIEESAYRVLIDAILEKVKDQDAEDKGDCSQGNGSSDDNSTPVAGPRNEVVPASSSMQVVLDTTSRCNEAMESASMSNEVHDPPSPLNEPDGNVRLLLPPEEGRVSEANNLEQNIEKRQIDTSMENKKKAASGGSEHPSNAFMCSPPFTVSSPLPMDGFPPRRRKPCYGWIDSDDEEPEIVELTPAPLSENLRRILDRVDGLDKSKKRRSGWDVRPQEK